MTHRTLLLTIALVPLLFNPSASHAFHYDNKQLLVSAGIVGTGILFDQLLQQCCHETFKKAEDCITPTVERSTSKECTNQMQDALDCVSVRFIALPLITITTFLIHLTLQERQQILARLQADPQVHAQELTAVLAPRLLGDRTISAPVA